MFILYGSGANGKSTFLNTIMYLLGDYTIATPTETFMRKNGDQYTNDIVRLRGTRFVTTTEAEQRWRLSEPLIKKITGNDQMTARFLSSLGNFLILPLRIPEEKQDKHLEMKLREEASGILNRLLEGTARWKREGLHCFF
jgi:putative DNA primase/helicase